MLADSSYHTFFCKKKMSSCFLIEVALACVFIPLVYLYTSIFSFIFPRRYTFLMSASYKCSIYYCFSLHCILREEPSELPGFGLGSWGFLKFFFYKGKLNIDNISMKRWSLWSLYNKRFLLFFYKRFLLFFSAVLDECISDTCSVKLHCVKFSRSSNVPLLLDFSLSEESI